MSKTGLVIGREYFSRVTKKSFLITTILVPILMVGFYAIILTIALKGGSDKQRIAIIDEANLLQQNDLNAAGSGASFKIVNGVSENDYVKKYKVDGYDALLYIPKMSIDTPGGFILHSPGSASLGTINKAEDLLNNAIVKKRLTARGLDEQAYKNIKADVSVTNTLDTETGSKKSVAGVAYGVSFACGILIYMMMIIYGTQVMRGVTEEKTNRIAEVIVSSVKPFQLMMGKIVGIGAVGLTQFAIWIVLIAIGQAIIPLFVPNVTDMAANVSGEAMPQREALISTITDGLASLPLLKIGLSFIFYFLAGYLTYASLFAAVGSVVSEDQQEAQQLMFPILMPIIIGFVIMTQAINEPNSTLAIFGSIFPLTSPIVMMGRITYDVPLWQIGLSIVLLILCFLLFTWITAKIYRIGILMYGKKPSWKQMARWAFTKS